MAAGKGTRLLPLTLGISKQLLPVFDKPLIYYALSTLMLAQIRDVLIISDSQNHESFCRLIGDGTNLGMSISFAIQSEPNGIAEGFLIGKHFIGNSSVTLALGDNIFYGQSLKSRLKALSGVSGAQIFAYEVNNPNSYGVVEFDSCSKIVSLEEKPKVAKSNYAIPGLYSYDNSVVGVAKSITPSARGELEITSVNQIYFQSGLLNMEVLDQDITWLDVGSLETFLAASTRIQTFELENRMKLACLEEVAWQNGWLTDEQLLANSEVYGHSNYGKYIRNLIKV